MTRPTRRGVFAPGGVALASGASGIWRSRILVTIAVFTLLITGFSLAPAQSASATDYPSWGDVLAARNDVAKKKAEIAKLQALLAQLEKAKQDTEAEAIRTGDIYQKAQDAFDAQDLKTQEYQKQADEAQAKADDSLKRAGQLAARLSRVGGGDFTTNLFFSGKDASNLLSQLGMASKISEQSKGLYDRAIRDQKTAQALTDQANVARAELERLKDIAEDAKIKAQAAADAAAAALKEQQDNNATLQAQLATLQTGLIHTEAEYVKGIQEAYGAGSGVVEISSQGWARPATGRVTSSFGARVPPVAGVASFHHGVDIGAGCGAPIYAAHSGTVVYAGWYGNLGNYIRIEHEGDVTSGYGHIVNGGILVNNGQEVVVGQLIAKVGTTGASTGCHLHFEVRQYGSVIDPVPFMRARGIIIQ